jgi:hypothetical protein
MNSLIEFHDSTLGEVWSSEKTVVVALRPAYIHQSTGRPGIDSGIGVT